MPTYAQRLTLLAERDLVLLSVPVLMVHAHRERTAAMQRGLRLALAAEASRAELTARYIAYASYRLLLPSASIVLMLPIPRILIGRIKTSLQASLQRCCGMDSLLGNTAPAPGSPVYLAAVPGPAPITPAPATQPNPNVCDSSSGALGAHAPPTPTPTTPPDPATPEASPELSP